MKKLQAFLYLLMRDKVPPGWVETVVQEVEVVEGEYVFSNSYLAAYAKEMSERLVGENKSQGTL